MEIKEKEEYTCDKLQEMFWKFMFNVSESCPRIALRADTRMIGMKHRIWLQKLSLMLKINNQSQPSLSRMILEEQRSNNWPGLSKEVTAICEKIQIPDLNENDFDITAGAIKEAVLEHHDDELRDKIKRFEKMEHIKDEDFSQVQDYLKQKSIENTRTAFKIRCSMVEDIKGNFKSKYRRNGGEEALLCQDCDCGEIQTQSHCLVCPKWEDIRTGLEMEKLEDVVKFFQKLLAERLKLKKKKPGSDSELHKKTPLPAMTARKVEDLLAHFVYRLC